MARGTCRCCGNEYNINADETVRYHMTERPECQAGPDSRKCKGAGQLPVGAPEPVDTSGEYVVGMICRMCKHPVQLTANDRARSHLDPRTNESCSGGSDWPLAVDAQGNRTDTRPQGEILPAARLEDLRIEPDRDFDPGTAQSDAASIFDETHAVTTDLGPEVHPGSAQKCRLPDCCVHGQGFEYGDDGHGHSGSFCRFCGTEEPEPCPPHEGNGSGRCVKCRMPWAEAEVENASAWKTPAHLMVDMPSEIQELAATNPECWDCEHEVTPLVARFGIVDGKLGVPVEIVWGCSRNCEHSSGSAHYGQPCRPQRPEQDRLGNLTEGCLFRRHAAKAPLSSLVYRVQGGSYGPDGPVSVTALVVSAGPYAGCTGTLINLDEEITCTDLNGRPRPRRDRPSPTPSAPARPAPSRAPTSTPTTTATAKPPSASRTAGSTKATSSGPSGTRSTPTPSAPTRSAVPDAFSTPKAALKESDKYDSYGRYKILHPDSSKKVNWTRATTFCKSIQDTYALSMWAQRMTLKGASLRPDLTAAAGTLEVKADKDRMNGLVDEAKKAAGDKVAANKGTAVHSYTEDRDRAAVGLPVKDRAIPEEFVPTVQAYEAILADFGLRPVPGLIEFTTAVKQYEVAGTADRVYQVTRDITIKLNGRPVTLYAGEYVIGDVKTGADLSYGWQEIAIQLALYSQGLNTAGVWSWEGRTWARPEVDGVQIQVRTDVGIVPHLPVDREETGAPLATLYAVDLTAGWAAAVLCGQVRSWRKERTLATPLEVADVVSGQTIPVRVHPEDGPVPQPEHPVSRPQAASRPVTLRDKAQAVTSRPEASAVYQEAVAARLPVAEVKELVQIMQDKLKSFQEKGA
jgi:hypothetical protein